MATAHATGILEVRLLGGFAVAVDGRALPASAWRRNRAADLVKLLALEPSHRLHREQVIEALWPELDPEAAYNNLRFTLHAARKRLEEAGADRETVLAREGESLVLGAAETVDVDVDAFEREAAAAWKSDDPSHTSAALARYPGGLLPDDPYKEWTESRRATLRAGYLALLRRLAELHLKRGEGAAAVAALERLVSAEPSDETAHVRLMRVLARLGQRQLALARYDRLVADLARELGAAPEPATTRLRDDIQAGRYPPPRAAAQAEAVARGGDLAAEPPSAANPPVRATLPEPVNPLIGREREVAEAGQLLTTARLVTLTGPGGVGKTRLAIQVATDAAAAFPDGVWFVGLAAITDPALVASTIAQVLGVREVGETSVPARLTAFLRDKHLLLVLDTFEQVIDAATLVSDMLAGCPNLKALITSRGRLRLSAEREYPVPPLGLAGGGRQGAAEDPGRSEAVRLFVERARAVKPDFVLTAENAPTVAAVCVRLDGLPLAIELAAVRVKVLRLPALLDRMERRLPLLTGGARDLPARQQTMRDAIGWSYDLLDEHERALFRRLSIFAGAFTMEAVAVVAGGREDNAADPGFDALEGVASLVDKSLLRQVEAANGEPTYVLLETVREFGREQLAASGEADACARRHAVWYLGLAERAAPELLGPEQRRWVERLDRDLPNLRAALAWLIEHDQAEQALRLAGALSSFWFLRGHLREGTAWLDQALARAPAAAPDTRSWALFSVGMLTWAAGDFAGAEAIGDRALAHAREHELAFGEARALYLLFLVSLAQGRVDQAVALGEQALPRMREAGNPGWLAYVLGDVGVELMLAGDRERGAAMVEEGLALHRALGNKQGVGNKLSDLAILKHDAGDEAAATRDYAESLRLLWEGGDTWYLATPVAGLAAIAMSAGNAAQAARLIGAVAALRARSGGALWPNEQARFERTVAAARAALGDTTYARDVTTGQSLPLAEVIAEAAAVADAYPGAAE